MPAKNTEAEPNKVVKTSAINHPLFRSIVFVLTAAFSGIIGNRADYLLSVLFSDLIVIGKVPDWITIITVLIIGLPAALVASVLVALPFTMVVLRLRKALHQSQFFDKVDKNIREMVFWTGASSEDRVSIHQLLESLLKDIADIFGPNTRVAILKYEPQKKDYLYTWHIYKGGGRSFEPVRFYIEADKPITRGVAGKAFDTGKAVYVNVRNAKKWFFQRSKYHAEHQDYIFIPSDNYNAPKYQSLIAYPLINVKENDKVIAILCIDSPKIHRFDSPETRLLVDQIAERVASAIVLADMSPKAYK